MNDNRWQFIKTNIRVSKHFLKRLSTQTLGPIRENSVTSEIFDASIRHKNEVILVHKFRNALPKLTKHANSPPTNFSDLSISDFNNIATSKDYDSIRSIVNHNGDIDTKLAVLITHMKHQINFKTKVVYLMITRNYIAQTDYFPFYHVSLNLARNANNPNQSFNAVLRNGTFDRINRIMADFNFNALSTIPDTRKILEKALKPVYIFMTESANHCDESDIVLKYFLDKAKDIKKPQDIIPRLSQIKSIKAIASHHHNLIKLKPFFNNHNQNNLDVISLSTMLAFASRNVKNVKHALPNYPNKTDEEFYNDLAEKYLTDFKKFEKNSTLRKLHTLHIQIREFMLLCYGDDQNSFRNDQTSSITLLSNEFTIHGFRKAGSTYDKREDDLLHFIRKDWENYHHLNTCKETLERRQWDSPTHQSVIRMIRHQNGTESFVYKDNMLLIDANGTSIDYFTKTDLCYLANLYQTLITQYCVALERSMTTDAEVSTLQRYFDIFLLEHILEKPCQGISDETYFDNFSSMEEIMIAIEGQLTRCMPNGDIIERGNVPITPHGSKVTDIVVKEQEDGSITHRLNLGPKNNNFNNHRIDGVHSKMTNINKRELDGVQFRFLEDLIGDSEHFMKSKTDYHLLYAEEAFHGLDRHRTLDRIMIDDQQSQDIYLERLRPGSNYEYFTCTTLSDAIINNQFKTMLYYVGISSVEEECRKYRIRASLASSPDTVSLTVFIRLNTADGTVFHFENATDTLEYFYRNKSKLKDKKLKIKKMEIIIQWRFTDNAYLDVPYFMHAAQSKLTNQITALINPVHHIFTMRRIGGHPTVTSIGMLDVISTRTKEPRSTVRGMMEMIAGGFKYHALNRYFKKYQTLPKILSFGFLDLPNEIRILPIARAIWKLFKEQNGKTLSLEELEWCDLRNLPEMNLDIRIIMMKLVVEPFMSKEVNNKFSVDALSADKAITESPGQYCHRALKRSKTKRFGIEQSMREELEREYEFLRDRNTDHVDVELKAIYMQAMSERKNPNPQLMRQKNKTDRKMLALNETHWANFHDIEYLSHLMIKNKTAICGHLTEKERELKVETARGFISLDVAATLVFQMANKLMLNVSKAVCPYISTGKTKLDQAYSTRRVLEQQCGRLGNVSMSILTDISKFCTSLRKQDMEPLCEVFEEITGSSLLKNANALFDQTIVMLTDPTLCPELDIQGLEELESKGIIGKGGHFDFSVLLDLDTKLSKKLANQDLDQKARNEIIKDGFLEHSVSHEDLKGVFTGRNVIYKPAGFFEGLLQSLWTVWLCELQSIAREVCEVRGTQMGSGDNQRCEVLFSTSDLYQFNDSAGLSTMAQSTNRVANTIKCMLDTVGVKIKPSESMIMVKGSYFLKRSRIGAHSYISSNPEFMRASGFDDTRDSNPLLALSSLSTEMMQRLPLSDHPLSEIFVHSLICESYIQLTSKQSLLANLSYQKEMMNARGAESNSEYWDFRLKSDLKLRVKNKHFSKNPSWANPAQSIGIDPYPTRQLEIQFRSALNNLLGEEHEYCKLIDFDLTVFTGLAQIIPLTLSPLQGYSKYSGPLNACELRNCDTMEILNLLSNHGPSQYRNVFKTVLTNIYHFPESNELHSGAILEENDIVQGPTPMPLRFQTTNLKEISRSIQSVRKQNLIKAAQELNETGLKDLCIKALKTSEPFAPTLFSAVEACTLNADASTADREDDGKVTVLKSILRMSPEDANEGMGTKYRKQGIKDAKIRMMRVNRDEDYEYEDEILYSNPHEEIYLDDNGQEWAHEPETPEQEFRNLKHQLPYNMIYSHLSHFLSFAFTFLRDIKEVSYDRKLFLKKLEHVQRVNAGSMSSESLFEFPESYAGHTEILIHPSEIEMQQFANDINEEKKKPESDTMGVITLIMHCGNYGDLNRISGLQPTHYVAKKSLSATNSTVFSSNEPGAHYLNDMMIAFNFLNLIVKDEQRQRMIEVTRAISGAEQINPHFMPINTKRGYGEVCHRTKNLLKPQSYDSDPNVNTIGSLDSRQLDDKKGDLKVRMDVMGLALYLFSCVRMMDEYRFIRPQRIYATLLVKKSGIRTVSTSEVKLDFEPFNPNKTNSIGNKNVQYFRVRSGNEMVVANFEKSTLVPPSLQTGVIDSSYKLDECFKWLTVNSFLNAYLSFGSTHGVTVSYLHIFDLNTFMLCIVYACQWEFWTFYQSREELLETPYETRIRGLFEIMDQIIDKVKDVFRGFGNVDCYHTVTNETIDLNLSDLSHSPQILRNHLISTFHKDIDSILHGSNLASRLDSKKHVVYYQHVSSAPGIMLISTLIRAETFKMDDYLHLYRRTRFHVNKALELFQNTGEFQEEFLITFFELDGAYKGNIDFGAFNHEAFDLLQLNDPISENIATQLSEQRKIPLLLLTPSGDGVYPLSRNSKLIKSPYDTVGPSLSTGLYDATGENSSTPMYEHFLTQWPDNLKCIIVLGSGVGFLEHRVRSRYPKSLIIGIDMKLEYSTQDIRSIVKRNLHIRAYGDCTSPATKKFVQKHVMNVCELSECGLLIDVEDFQKFQGLKMHVVYRTLLMWFEESPSLNIKYVCLKTKGLNFSSQILSSFDGFEAFVSDLVNLRHVAFLTGISVSKRKIELPVTQFDTEVFSYVDQFPNYLMQNGLSSFLRSGLLSSMAHELTLPNRMIMNSLFALLNPTNISELRDEISSTLISYAVREGVYRNSEASLSKELRSLGVVAKALKIFLFKPTINDSWKDLEVRVGADGEFEFELSTVPECPNICVLLRSLGSVRENRKVLWLLQLLTSVVTTECIERAVDQYKGKRSSNKLKRIQKLREYFQH
jgi:hypothetical protein